MEDKYDDQVKKEKKKRRSKKKTEVDDYEEIDTSDVREKGEPATAVAAAEMTTPEKPVIKQITFDLNVEGEFVLRWMIRTTACHMHHVICPSHRCQMCRRKTFSKWAFCS